MSLGTLRAGDVPPGPIRIPKDYDRSLCTQDLPRARPLLAHPTNGSGEPVPWNALRKPPPGEIPKAKPRTLYPPVSASRPRDLSLTTSDIEFAQCRKPCRNSQGRERSDCIVDPLTPTYRMASSEAQPPPEVWGSGRDTMDVSDIPGTAPSPVVPMRREYRDTLRLEAEFRSPRGRAVPSQDPWRTTRPAAPGEGRRACCTPTLEGPARSGRQGENPLDPRYRVPVSASAALATSLHARWAEERRVCGNAAPTTECQEIGHIHGSRVGERRVGEHGGGTITGNKPPFTLQTEDVEGAQPMRRVGNLPLSMYSARGNRPALNPSLNTGDIFGAQAGTLARGPKPTAAAAARRANALAATGSMAVGGHGDTGERPVATPRSELSGGALDGQATLRPGETHAP